MCKVLKDMRREAVLKAKAEDIRNIMESFKIDADKAMDALKIALNERAVYAAQL